MDKVEESEDLKIIRKELLDNKIPAAHALEFYCLPSQTETLKEKIRKKTKGECLFFVKEENNKIHLIAIRNLKVIASSEGLKVMETVINSIKDKSFTQGSFDPNGIVFGSAKKTSKTKK